MARRLTLGDRIAAAVVGAIVGAFVGLALAWLMGVVHSHRLPEVHGAVDFKRWVLTASGGFALVGLVLGPFVGSLLGAVITAVFDSQQPSRDTELPGWLVGVLLVAVAIGGWWWWWSK